MLENNVGSYMVTLLDKTGGEINHKKLGNSGFIVARAYGDASVSAADCYSFTISRVLYDSLLCNPERFDIKR